ncbi:MAG: DoxX family protein [Candidatus Pacearchaeota archaeon]
MNRNLVKCAPLIGRVFISLVFIVAGVGKITGFDGTVGFIQSFGLPFATLLAMVAIIIEVVGGLMLLTGFKTRSVATILIIFTALASIIFHIGEGEINVFLKNLAIIGGLIMVLAHGPGNYCVDRR